MNTSDYSTNLELGQFSPSSLKVYLQCPRMFWWQYSQQLRAKKGKAAMDFGGIMHEVLKVWREKRKSSSEERLAYALQNLATIWPSTLNDPKRNLATAMAAIKAYHERYMHEDKEWTQLEVPFKLQMPNGTFMVGIIDALAEGRYVEMLDSKTTTSTLTDYYFNGFKHNFQFLGYDHAITQLVGHCDHVCVDAVQVPCTKPEHLQRRTLFHTDNQRSEWLHTYTRITNEIMERVKIGKEAFYQNHESCTRYGLCDFLQVCVHGEDHPSLRMEFEQKGAAKE